ncbi:Bug family tripartite tricarboxylate transporter substrate binding protein [Achromobacter xylosoxidans]|uniref:Bug family tripartite tricarboxylate transporter substrate binding protein n=1 Tax=Alcaligenes xylosoxydans xylosoxydans TaxID=85698 RepID=UPI000B48AAF7|nr:tripartite tricarboxylate transporter substrate binding protein [Achromobacter xylosoxidans]
MDRRHFLEALAAAALVAVAPLARAQDGYPRQLIKWVVPYSAGGGTDILARALAEAMRAELGQQIIIDNRPGAATNIGAEYVARAKPDGYTVLSAGSGVLAFNEHLFRKLPFSPENDFSYIGAIGRFPLVLVANPAFPAADFQAFLARVQAEPGQVNYASPGNGSSHHLAMELFQSRTGTRLTHVPYRGAAQAMQDVIGGQVPVMFLDLASGAGIIKAGKVRPLAIGSQVRSALLPEVPTLAELGVADAEVFAFQGLLGPAGLPAPVVARLNQALNAALSKPEVFKLFTEFGFEPLPGTPEAFKTLARAESARWGEVIRANKIVLD